jgi:hypothetical protein
VDGIRLQLDRILANAVFTQTEGFRRLLRYIVEQTVYGHVDQLKNTPWRWMCSSEGNRSTIARMPSFAFRLGGSAPSCCNSMKERDARIPRFELPKALTFQSFGGKSRPPQTRRARRSGRPGSWLPWRWLRD